MERWQIYLLVGLLFVGYRIGTTGFRRNVPARLYRAHQEGFSLRASYAHATIAAVVAVFIWPWFIISWLKHWARR